MKETPAQFTARMREKYAEALEKLEEEGPNEDQKLLKRLLDKMLGEETKVEKPKYEKLSDILRRH